MILWLFTVAVTAKRRRASDSILDLTTRSGVDDNLDSLDLRGLITERLPESTPLKLLHYVAPKIPAIKHSPDVALRIQSARSDSDSGVAACLLGAIGYSCELVPREDRTSVTRELLQDRRLEQLVECLLCGVDVPKRMAEYTSSELDHVNIDEILDAARFDEGLSIRDSCRAAWGLSILGAHQAESLGGEKVEDILIALSLRIRELLLARLQLLRHDDLYNINQSSEAMQTVEERLSEVSEELAEDASLALWTFACVRACTGVSSKAMNNICYTILCQEPGELRKRAQEEAEMAPPEDQLGSNDVVDRLALAEEDTKGPDNADVALDLEEYQLQAVDGIAPEATTCLLDWLSPLEAVDTIWSLALHGHESRVSDGDSRSRAQALCEILSDRLLSWLESERHETLEAAAVAQDHGKESMDATLADVELKEAHSEEVIEHTTTITFDDGEDGEAEAEVMDASAILATERGDSDAETVPDMAIDDVEHSEEEASDEAFHERGEHVQVEVAVPEALFSSHDLCSIAWSLTELDDPLKDCVNEIVVDVLEARGMSTIRGLGGGDLSNLGWAIARAIQEYSDAPSVESSPVLVTEWITEDVLKETGDFIGSPFEAADKLLDRFQPPELSRFLWSIAVSLGSCRGRHLVTEAASELAMLGLLVASRHESLFGPEELARVLWAALELTTFDALASRPLIWEAVGSILCSIEASLGAWENSVSSPGDHQDPSREPGRFVALFGRNRRHQRRLLERYEDGTDESEDMPMPSFLRKTRPKLREIPVDPATLCKLAHGVSDLCCNLPGSKERSVRLLTTALRLMTSRDGRLLSECNLSDVVRLSVAVAQSGPGIRELSGLFTRRLTRMLNTMNSLTMSFRPVDACRLAWSLGEHGVKYSPEHVGEEGAHRRLTLTSVGPFVGVDELDGLVSKDLSRLVRRTNAVSNRRVSLVSHTRHSCKAW